MNEIKMFEKKEWLETSEERFFEMLEVLPPEMMLGGGFLVGEPAIHKRDGISGNVMPAFDAYKKIGKFGSDEKFFVYPEPVTMPEFKELMKGNII